MEMNQKKNNVIKDKKIFTIIKKIIVCSIFGIILSFSISFLTSAESEYYSNLSDEELRNIFSLNLIDIKFAWRWIADTQTYVVVEKNNDDICYWWNAPNIQSSAFNSLYSLIQTSGYGSNRGVLPKDNDNLLVYPNYDYAKTALQKYGCNIPNPAYVGERPLITINILGIMLPDSYQNYVVRLAGLIFTGDIVSKPTAKDLNSLTYLAPRDYNNGANTFEAFVEEYWEDIMHDDGTDGDLYIQPGQVLNSQANDDDGMFEGACWVRDTIIDQNGLANETDAKIICNKLQEICGRYYPDVAKNIILSSGVNTSHMTERIMPYDLSRMNSIDADKFDKISDPRSDMQQNLLSTGYMNVFTNMFKTNIVTFSGKIAEISIALNKIYQFEFLEAIGLSPTILWTSSIFSFLILLMTCVFLFFCIKSCYILIRHRQTPLLIITRVLGIFLLTAIVYAFSMNPNGTYEIIKNTTAKIWNISNISLENNVKISALYGNNANSNEKLECSLWLPYFNVWTSYHTNHNLFDETQTLNKDTIEPEEDGLKMPKINEKEQTLWSTVLADNFTSNKNYSGNIYRVVDHFMAPRIKDVQLTNDNGHNNADFNVEINENYNGNIQSGADCSPIPFQILIFIVVIFKVLLFVEFIIKIAMLFINICLTVTNTKSLGKVLKTTGASALNIMFINMAITLLVYSSLIATGISSIIICVVYVFMFIKLISALAKSNSVFKPKILELTQKGVNKVKGLFE